MYIINQIYFQGQLRQLKSNDSKKFKKVKRAVKKKYLIIINIK